MSATATIKAFKRAPSVEMSTWYKGILISNLVTNQDTGGAFEFVVTKMKRGTEPPPHIHEREDEMFYVLDGMLDAYVGDECIRVDAGECVFMPKGQAHAFRISSPEIHMLVLMTPGGFHGCDRDHGNSSAGLGHPT